MGLMSFETRRVRGDLIEVFKFLSGSYTVDANICWNMIRVIEETILRNCFKRRSRLDVRKYVVTLTTYLEVIMELI